MERVISLTLIGSLESEVTDPFTTNRPAAPYAVDLPTAERAGAGAGVYESPGPASALPRICSERVKGIQPSLSAWELC
jgi:hypothetical protein